MHKERILAAGWILCSCRSSLMKGNTGTGTGRVLSKKDIKKEIIIADPPSNAEGILLS